MHVYSIHTYVSGVNIAIKYTYVHNYTIMKVHFAASTSQILELGDQYSHLCQMVKKMGHTITRDWLPEAIAMINSGNKDIPREGVYEEVMKAILSCDVVIAEGTTASFSLGHQITLPISKGKPVLFLKYEKYKAKKRFTSEFVDGIRNPLLTVAKYNNETLPDILNDFLNKNGASPVVKFNIVLTKEIENYLNWASYTYKLNKSEFIRKLILSHMANDDLRYQKFIGNSKNL